MKNSEFLVMVIMLGPTRRVDRKLRQVSALQKEAGVSSVQRSFLRRSFPLVFLKLLPVPSVCRSDMQGGCHRTGNGRRGRRGLTTEAERREIYFHETPKVQRENEEGRMQKRRDGGICVNGCSSGGKSPSCFFPENFCPILRGKDLYS